MSVIDDLSRIKWNNLGAIGNVVNDVTSGVAKVGDTVKTTAQTIDQAQAVIAAYAKQRGISQAQAAAELAAKGIQSAYAVQNAQQSITGALSGPLGIGLLVIVALLLLRR